LSHFLTSISFPITFLCFFFLFSVNRDTTGVATTFINKDVEESALLDLKHLLIEAKQRVPPVLQALDDPDDTLMELDGLKGCAFCGGLGHRITNCPKLDKDARKIGAGMKDSLAGQGGDW
jgi:ATP-dependent RNA helicase DDX41